MNKEVVIGVEIHCELKTKSKMFSDAPVAFGAKPNTCVNEIDLGHPGTLPTLNKEAVRLSLIACGLLGFEIERLIRFDRKNYYYSDLPKGFQITQQAFPIGKNGHIDIEVDGVKKRIGITRLHMEEDTAKQFHNQQETLIDYNRSGVPLIEIVSEPVITSGKEAAIYVETLRNILVHAQVTDGKMEEGSLRCDINISLKDVGSSIFGVKVEIKNINSLNNIQKAVESEIARQLELYKQNIPVQQQTRRYDEASKSTVLMREKESAVDYKYFSEPNIFPTWIDDQFFDQVINNLPQTPAQQKLKLIQEDGLSEYDANVLIQQIELFRYYQLIQSQVDNKKLAINWLISELLAVKNEGASYEQLINPQYFVDFITLIDQKEISSKQAKEIFPELCKNQDPKALVAKLGLSVVHDELQLQAWIDEAIANHPQSVIDFKNGKDRAVGFLVGQIMKVSKGKADPAKTNEMVRTTLLKA